MSPPPWLTRGANVLASGGVRFSVWAPRAGRVTVRAAHTRGPSFERPLEPTEGGVFAGDVGDAAAGDDYVFRLGDGVERADPVSRHQPHGVHGPSRVVDPRQFRWTDAGWPGVERADLVLYELHVGTFTEAGTFDAVAQRLPALRELGVTAIELMPVAAFPGTRNWGYDGVFPYAPQESYGGPEGLRGLVDSAHAAGLAVVLDVVYNHLGPEGNVLGAYGPYFTSRHRTPWGEAVNFDGPGSDEVRRFFVDNAVHWFVEYHVDGLRLDAVHAIHDESAEPFLAELASTVQALEPTLDRRLHVIAESDRNDPRLVRSRERGGFGLDAVWSDDFHHAVHAAFTGERQGYYVDFGSVTTLAKAVSDRFVYDGVPSIYRGRRHGAPARDVPADRFVVFVQNHDQVGNRALGERLAALLPPAQLRVAAALLLLSPYLPLLFMGEEYGETTPFLYFVSHQDPELLKAVRRGRREEFAGFDFSEDVPDPAAEATFQRSRLRFDRAAAPEHAPLRRLYGDLLRVRREEPALRPGAASVSVDSDADAGWLAVSYRLAGAHAAWAAFHLGATAAEVPVPGGSAEGWRRRLTTDDAIYGGKGPSGPERITAPRGTTTLSAETASLFVGEEA